MFALAGRAAAILALLAGAALATQTSPDPLVNLSRETSGVFLSAEGPRLLLSEEEYGVISTRTLSIGDEYRDGWILKAMDGNLLTLTKGGVTRTIRPMGARAAPPVAPAPALAPPAAPTAIAKIGSSNAGIGAAGVRANIEAAIANGDVARVTALGGTSAEIGLAKFAALDKQRLQLLKTMPPPPPPGVQPR